jgi:hypothetical protein
MSMLCTLVIAFFMQVAIANAATIYSYVGPTFNSFGSGGVQTPTPGPDNPYDNTMQITGWFKTDQPLADNLPYTSLNSLVIDFSFSDGVNTINMADIGSLDCEPGIYNCWYVETDGDGNITDWLIGIATKNLGEMEIGDSRNYIFTETYAMVDLGAIQTCTAVMFGACVSVDNVYGHVWDQPRGVWTTTVVPVPAALPLLAFGLGALGFVGWRRKQSVVTAD